LRIGLCQKVETQKPSVLRSYLCTHGGDLLGESLSSGEIERGVVDVITNAVWNKSRDIRDCVSIGNMTKSLEDVRFIVETFL